MILTQASVGLSLTVMLATLVYACQPEVIQDNRGVITGGKAQPASQEDDAKSEDKPAELPKDSSSRAGGTPPPSASFTLAWNVSADPTLLSYKVFIVPPDRNPRFPGKTDVPIQIRNYPIASLSKIGEKYSVTVSTEEIKTALGATALNPAAYCFTVVAVNGVGNSTHSPVICP